MDENVITFDDWEKVLKASAPPDRYRVYLEAIVIFRYWLREPIISLLRKDFLGFLALDLTITQISG